MRRKRSIIVIALVTAMLLAAGTTTVMAEESMSEIREKIEKKKDELEQTKEDLKEGEAQQKSLASQVSELEKELGKLDTAIAEGEANLAVLEQELAAAQERVETQSTNLNARLRNMYKSGSIGFLDVLMDSGSFSEFLTNLDMVKKIYNSDQTVLDELEEAHQLVEDKKQEVEALQAELEYSKTMTQQQKQTVEQKKAEIEASNEEMEKMIDELQKDADALTAKLQQIASSSETSTYTGGQMAWPTPSSSYITSPFGYRIHPIYGYRKFHTGMDIGASSGSAIVAANPGTVIYAGWNGGYGKCVIIDHGGGITTLYAHASSILVGNGQSVSRGETVALVGSTGNSTGPHLHFEVRVNGQYVNPYPYVT